VKINIFNTETEVLANLAAYFVTIANNAIVERGRFSVALSGGSSPKKLYELLSSPAFKEKVDWQKVDFFFGDERYVLQTDSNSNYLMAKKALFEPLKIEPAHIFAVNTSLEVDNAAEQYTAAITKYFAGGEMRFDLVLLGLGDNSHTASLFPHTTVLHDINPSVKAVYLGDQKKYRITFTAPLINQAHHVAFLVYGDTKATAVHHIIEDERDFENFPAQLIAPIEGNLQWFLDATAASQLKSTISR
jgi:6-phosphogluconolactonase